MQSSIDAREAADDRRAVQRLELVKARSVDEPRDDLVHVVLRPNVLRYEGVEIFRIVCRRLGHDPVVDAPIRGTLELGDDLARDGDGVRIVEREMIRDTGDAGVQIGAAELLGRDLDAGGGFYERRTTDEDRSLTLHDHGLVAHRGYVRAPGG